MHLSFLQNRGIYLTSLEFPERRKKGQSIRAASLIFLSRSVHPHVCGGARLCAKGNDFGKPSSSPHEQILGNPSVQTVMIVTIILILTIDLTDHLENRTCKGKDRRLTRVWRHSQWVTSSLDVLSSPLQSWMSSLCLVGKLGSQEDTGKGDSFRKPQGKVRANAISVRGDG